MGDGNWFGRGKRARGGKRLKGSKSRHGRQGAGRLDRAKLGIEPLEDRRVLATFLVNSLEDVDSGGAPILGSLRWALAQANAADDNDTIVFADSLYEGYTGEVINFVQNIPTIALNGGALNIAQPVRIQGPGGFQLMVAQTGLNSRVFDISIGDDDEAFPVQISGLTIVGGNIISGDGGAIYNRESLTMNEVRMFGNSANGLGGAIYVERGGLTVNRSLLAQNSAAQGGAIASGADDTQPRVRISTSTLVQNSASGNPDLAAWGGAIFNRNGQTTVEYCTITGNSAGEGGGIASFGNPVPEEEGGEPPPRTVQTVVTSSIVWGNEEGDLVRVGQTEDDPPVDLEPSAESAGYNIIGVHGDDVENIDPATDQIDVDPMFATDPRSGEILFGDFGGSTEVFLLDPMSPAIDKGPERGPQFDQRGMHFTRSYGTLDPEMPVLDIGATEMQEGLFFVDTLLDDDDRSFAMIFRLTFEAGAPVFALGGYEVPGDLSLREAIEFARKHPGPDVIQFSEALNTADVLAAEDRNGGVPTITLGVKNLAVTPASQGSLLINEDLVIEGPTTYILEVDASGNDLTPGIADGKGTRVFEVDDVDNENIFTFEISNLTVMGADFNGRGGAFFSRENLTLRHMTLKNNLALDDGGGIYINHGALIVEESTFNGNRASDDGGAFFIDTLAGNPATTATFVNSTISGNIAGDRGAGLLNQNSEVSFDFSTITLNNSGSTRGSGITNFGADAVTTVYATIISSNIANDVEFFSGATSASFVSEGYNYIGRGNGNAVFTETGDRRNANTPMLAPLFNTGGLIQTHRPLLGSPLIDAGPETPDMPPEFDQRGQGFERTTDGDLDGTARVDIGSYELQELLLLVDSTFDENDKNTSPSNFSLREAIELANANPLPDRIEFEPTLVEQLAAQVDAALFLSTGGLQVGTAPELRITDSLTIVGPGSSVLAINGLGLALAGARMLTVDDGDASSDIVVSISGLTFRQAEAPLPGAAIFSREELTLDDLQFINNKASDVLGTALGLHGGAVHQQTGKLTISNSLFTGNSTIDAAANGGAIYGVDTEIVINDTTIAGNSTEVSGNGGGVAVLRSTLLSNATTFSGNSTLAGIGDGGGIHADSSVVRLVDAVVSDNFTVGANSEGGGIAAINSDVTLVGTALTLNNTHGAQSHGGGIATQLDSSRPGSFRADFNGDGLTNGADFLTWQRNFGRVGATQAQGDANGDAVVDARDLDEWRLFAGAVRGALTIEGSILAQNATAGLQSYGGAIAVQGGVAKLFQSNVSQNLATGESSHGGGLANLGGSLVVRDTAVYGNQATSPQSKGGGIYSDTNLAGTQQTQIINSTVSGNLARSRGGGVFNADGQLDILYSTISNNDVQMLQEAPLPDVTLPNAGAGVASQGNVSTRTSVHSSIIAGNIGDGGGTDVDSVDAAFQNSFQSLGYNVIGRGNSAGNFTGPGDQANVLDPLLGPLEDNEGNFFFFLPTHALLPGSPAINAGNPAFNPLTLAPVLSYDQRGAGFDRVQDGRIDVGAYESSAAAPASIRPAASAALMAADVEDVEKPAAAVAPAATPQRGAFVPPSLVWSTWESDEATSLLAEEHQRLQAQGYGGAAAGWLASRRLEGATPAARTAAEDDLPGQLDRAESTEEQPEDLVFASWSGELF